MAHLKRACTAKGLRCGVAGLLATCGAACANISLPAAVALGNTGVQASTTYQRATTALGPGLDNFLQGQYMLAALEPAKYSPPTGDLVKSIAQVEAALTARAALLGQLSQVYTAFVALAAYDAAGQVQTGLTNLDGSINVYATALGAAAPPIAAGVDSAIGATGGLFATAVQEQQVRAASAAIVPRLRAVVDLLGKENMIYAALQDELVRGQRDTALSLWRHGIGAPDAILSAQIGALGLTYVKGSYAHACANVPAAGRANCRDQFAAAIRAAVEQRANRLAALQVQTMQSNQAALKGLIAAHGEFAKGQPPDLASVTAQLASIRQVIDDLNRSNAQQ